MREKRRNLYTLSGLAAVLIWSFTGVIGGNATHIPIFQFLFLSSIAATLILAGSITLRGKWKEIFSQPKWFLICTSLLVGFNQLSYIMAFRYAPAEQVDLINYQWPMLLTLAVSLLPRERFHWTYLVGGLVGMAGVWWMFLGDGHTLSFSGPALIGSLCAATGAIAWIAYCLVSRLNRKAPTEVIIAPVAACIPLFALLQWLCDARAAPMTLTNLGLATGWGSGCMALAFMFWDTGIRKGNINALSLISYLTPIGSIALLVVFGLAPGSLNLAIASGMIVLGCLTGGYGPKLSTARNKLEEVHTDEERLAA